MAVNTFTGAVNSNTSVAGNWSLGTTPVQGDGHVVTFDAASPNAIVNAELHCDQFDASAFTGNITMDATINFYGDVTLGSSMSFIPNVGALHFHSDLNLQSNGVVFPGNVGIGANGFNNTITLLNNFECTGQTTNGATSSTTIITINGAFRWITAGYQSQNLGSLIGNLTALRITGGSIITSGSSPTVNVHVEFDGNINSSGGNLNLLGTGQNITYLSGAVDLSGLNIQINATATVTFIDMWPVTFGSLGLRHQSQLTLVNSDITVSNLGIGTTNSPVLNGGTISVTGNCSTSNNTGISGTGKIKMIGTGNLASSGVTGFYNCEVEIDTVGTITIGAVFRKGGGTLLKLTNGTVDTTTNNSDLVLQTCPVDTQGMVWNRVNIINTHIVTCISLFKGITLNVPSGFVTFDGAGGVEFANWLHVNTSAAHSSITLTPTQNYLVTNYFRMVGTSTGNVVLASSHATNKAIFTVQNGAIQDISKSTGILSSTRIDSSGGDTVFAPESSILDDTINWELRNNANFLSFM